MGKSKITGRGARALVAVLALSGAGAGCAPKHCTEGDPTREWACPTDAMVAEEVAITDAFERFFFELSEDEAACVADYFYRESEDAETIRDICGAAAGCQLHHPRTGARYIAVLVDEDPWVTGMRQRHEVLHVILRCSGVVDEDHAHPVFTGHLDAYPDGSWL